MRINNKRINIYIETLYNLLFIGLIFSIILLYIPISFLMKHISPYMLIGIFLLAIFLLYKLGHMHVEYNSDGETLNIKTQDPFWIKYFPRSRIIVDFPKKKLISFKIEKGFFQRKLIFYVTSKRSHSGYTKLTFYITFLNKTEVSDLKRSLNRIVKRNQENRIKNLEEVNGQ